MKIDPIIAVKDVVKSSEWYRNLFGLKSMHGGDEFEILVDDQGEVILCLHKWGEHEHPTMMHPASCPGNGLILYMRTENLEEIRENVINYQYELVKDIHINNNSHKREFSLFDPDGYYLTITEYHEYKG